MKLCAIGTYNKKGNLTHTRLIHVQSKEELEQQVRMYQAMGIKYNPEITENKTGQLILIWREQ